MCTERTDVTALQPGQPLNPKTKLEKMKNIFIIFFILTFFVHVFMCGRSMHKRPGGRRSPAKSGTHGKSMQCLVCSSAAVEVGLSVRSEMSETCGTYRHMWHLWNQCMQCV